MLQKCSMHIDWDDLRYLRAATAHPTLSQAARALGVAQTTLSRRLARLQDAMGTRLLERDAHGLALTTAGQHALQAAEAMGEHVARLGQLAGDDSALSGELRVTTLDMIAVQHAALFQAFTAQYPAITLEVSATYTTRNLTRREADVALRLSRQPPAHLVGRRLCDVDYAAYIHTRLLTQRDQDDQQLTTVPWVTWDGATGPRRKAAWMTAHDLDSRVVLRVDTAQSMYAAVCAGAGAGFIPVYDGERHPDLVQLVPPVPHFRYTLWALTHEELRRTARVRAFMQAAGAYFSARRGAFCPDAQPESRRDPRNPGTGRL